MGVVLGISVGGAILAFVLSLFFGRASRCIQLEVSASTYLCEHKGIMVGIWFWSGLVFWLNTAISVLIAVGRDELIYLGQSDYETIGISMDEFQNSFETYNAQAQADADFVQVGEAAVGDTEAQPLSRHQRLQSK